MDLSRIGVSDAFFKKMEKPMKKAFSDMASLERGEIANPDEGRMVGHYWLRNSALSPSACIRSEIDTNLKLIKAFARKVHQGKIRGQECVPAGRIQECDRAIQNTRGFIGGERR